MMKKLLSILIIFAIRAMFWPIAANAQSFTDISTSMLGVYDCSVAWGDYDNDGDLDILLTGHTGSSVISKIYRNENGNFVDISAPLQAVYGSSVAWGDYDNDGDLDILLTGWSRAKIYRNDSGSFVNIATSLSGLYFSAVAWGDYDNDGDLDILFTGRDAGTGYYISKVYRNDGGSFVDIVASLTGVYDGAVAWGDYDNDGDLDILLTGNTGSSSIAKIYRNNAGSFVDIAASMIGVYYSSVSWGDYDNDGDLDILLAGYTNPGKISKIYRNDSGSFVDISASLAGVSGSSVAWGDYDNDGDLDILLTGYSSSGRISKVFRNDSGSFVDINAGLIGANGDAAWGDYDNDGDLDILLTGYTGSSRISKIYRNDIGTVNTIPSAPTNLTSSVTGNSVTLNWDKSTDSQTAQDALTYNLRLGTTSFGVEITSPMAILTSGYRKVPQLGFTNHNNSWTIKNLAEDTYYWSVQTIDNAFAGSGFATQQSFSIIIPAPTLTSISPDSGYQGQTIDVVFTGTNFMSGITSVSFVADITVNSTTVNSSTQITANITIGPTAALGARDVSVTNAPPGGGTATLTNGFTVNQSAFTDISASLTGVNWSSVAWGDYDNDGDLDILLSGNTGSGYISKVYRNDVGSFVDISASLTGVNRSSVAWGDYDNDGDLDILLTGDTGSGYISKVYRNDVGSFVDITASLTGIGYGAVAWGDYDNDGDLDIILTGWDGSNRISKVYRNDSGSFVEITTSLMGGPGSAAWGDYDNDGDLDILLTGSGSSSARISKVYRNDGGGNFMDINASLTEVDFSSAAWGDYDNDGDLDILLTGRDSNLNDISKVYRNDGGGNFVDINTSLIGVRNSYVAWSDYDNDGDFDILLTGYIGSSFISKVYRNDDGNFVDIAASLTGVGYSAVALGDYDNDGDLDILLTGYFYDGSPNYISKVYRNNTGTTNSDPTAPTNLTYSVTGNSVTFNWDKSTDNETAQNGLTYNLRLGTTSGGVEKVLPMAEGTTGYRRVPQLGNTNHMNTWNIKRLPGGTYYWSVQAIDNAFAGSSFATEQSFSFDNLAPTLSSISPESGYRTRTLDVVFTGTNFTDGITTVDFGSKITVNSTTINSSTQITANITIASDAAIGARDVSVTNPEPGGGTATLTNGFTVNEIPFTDISAALTILSAGSVEWGDYDNDGDLDILLTGTVNGSSSAKTTKLYNNNNGSFEYISTSLANVYLSSIAWGDYDNDGDLDILLTGSVGPSYISWIYRNDGSGSFVNINASLTGVGYSSVEWGDYDNDGDLDILLTGHSGSSNISKVYRNDSGSFVDISASLTAVRFSSVAWGDYDNDGDLDILLTGYTGSTAVSKIYRNGSGSFTDISASLTGVEYSSVDWGDYDNDGDLDILLTGYTGSVYVSKIYRNDSGSFSDISASLTGVRSSSAAWGDYDNDGDLDILLTGYVSSSSRICKVYQNSGGSFEDIDAFKFGVYESSVAWGDYDNDGDLDILLTGYNGSTRISKVYRNNCSISNTVPNAPINLSSSVSGSSVTLSWDKSTDSQTAQDALTYNLRIGSTPIGVEEVSPMANVSNGYRRLSQLGNTNHRNSWTIDNLPNGNYYWSVQAIDNAFAGSVFTEEQTFTVGQIYSESETATQGNTVSFNESGDGHTVEITFNSLSGNGNVTVQQFNAEPYYAPCLNAGAHRWEITNEAGINSFSTDISFHYTDTDATGYIESAAFFGIAKYNESTSTWQWLGGTVDANNNTVTVSGVTSFSTFALYRRIFGDITGDGYVDAADLQRLGDCWHSTNSGEFTAGVDARFFNFNKNTDDGNQIIDAADLQVFGDCWHNGVAP